LPVAYGSPGPGPRTGTKARYFALLIIQRVLQLDEKLQRLREEAREQQGRDPS
jgi:hypothetical protein